MKKSNTLKSMVHSKKKVYLNQPFQYLSEVIESWVRQSPYTSTLNPNIPKLNVSQNSDGKKSSSSKKSFANRGLSTCNFKVDSINHLLQLNQNIKELSFPIGLAYVIVSD